MGAWAVKAVELEGSARRPILRTLGLVKLSPGVVEDGEWKQTEEIVKGLAGLWWCEDLDRGRVVLGLTGPHIHVRRVPFEKLPLDFLRKRVAKEAHYYLPFDPKTTALDFQIVGTGVDYEDLLLVAVPHELIERSLQLLSSLELKPLALEVEAIGLFNLWELNYPEERDGLIIHIGYERTRLVYIHDRKPLSSRVSLWGTRDCLMRIEKQAGIHYASAEKVLEGERTFDELPTIIGDFAQELAQRLEDDRKFLPSGFAAGKCYLSGGGSLLPDFSQFLKPQFDCEPFAPFRKIEVPLALKKSLDVKVAPVFALATGLALRGLDD